MRTVEDQLCVNLGTKYAWISWNIHILRVDSGVGGNGRIIHKVELCGIFLGTSRYTSDYGSAEGTNYA
jgi:hypothetical protein